VRILTIGNMYPPLHLGGYELIWEEAVSRLRRAGHEVRVLTSDFRRDELEGEDPAVRRDLRLYWRDHEWPLLRLRERLAIERHNGAAFEREVGEVGPDAILWTAMGGMSLSLTARAGRHDIPGVGLICDEWLLYGPQRDSWSASFGGPRRALRPLARLFFGLPAGLDTRALGPSLFMSELLRRRALRVHRLARTEVAYLGPDRRAFKPAPQAPWRWRLLYAGRLDPRKGVDLAVGALSRLPSEATLAVIGGGDTAYRRELEELAAATGVGARVRFGEVPREGLASEYAAADALLFPIRWLEPWGLVPLEAMAVGTPVVASARGGPAEYLRDGENSLVFDADGGSEALAAAVLRLAGDEALRGRLRAGGLRTSEEFDEDGFYGTVETLLAEVAA
jgi:glycosyltransferase involved in cell wall biosynthesis